MFEIFSALSLIGLLFVLLGMGLWVGFSLIVVGIAALALLSNAPAGLVLATTLWANSHKWALTALPLFIFMGEILIRGRLSEDLFAGLSPWLNKLPGRLLHANVLGCTVFAAVSGSSAATAATVGRIALPELQRRGYPENMTIGTLAGSATLGLLIPPSIILIVYGVATDQSIAQLFVAAILPGLLLVVLFAGYVMLYALIYPEKIPREASGGTFADKLRASRRLIPVALLIIMVLGSIYTGVASPTDAAAVGVVGSLVIVRLTGTFTWNDFVSALMKATRTSAMIAFILAGAGILTVAMGFTGFPRHLTVWIGSLGLSPAMLLLALTVFFVIIGCFLDGISIVVLTTGLALPIIQAAGFDPIWFGIYLVIVVEMSQITPPVGFNLFVIQGMTGLDILRIAYASLPFFLLMLVSIVIIAIFPQIVTYLPNSM